MTTAPQPGRHVRSSPEHDVDHRAQSARLLLSIVAASCVILACLLALYDLLVEAFAPSDAVSLIVVAAMVLSSIALILAVSRPDFLFARARTKGLTTGVLLISLIGIAECLVTLGWRQIAGICDVISGILACASAGAGVGLWTPGILPTSE